MDQSVSFRFGILGLVGALALGGCGRKGPLELPPNAPAAPQSQAADTAPSRVLPIADNPGLIQPANKVAARPPAPQPTSRAINVPAPQTGKPFILDPLL